MLAALRAESGAGTFHGRVRGADGSWRQVSATLSRYGRPGEPAKLLITCHDDSELVALRQQVTQLTFHDGLTGLPNRAYLEDRVKELSQVNGVADDRALWPRSWSAWTAMRSCMTWAGSRERTWSSPRLAAGCGRPCRPARSSRAGPATSSPCWSATSVPVSDADFGVASTGPVAELAERLTEAIGDEPFSVADKEISLTACAGVATCAYGGADQVLGNAS